MSEKPKIPKSASNLSSDEVDELREAFSVFDKDDSGSITAQELGELLRSITPAVVANIDDAMLAKLVQKFDNNGDGSIDFNEFLDLMCQAGALHPEDELGAAFAIFDKDGDGTITAKELREVMNALGEDVDEETCLLMIRSVDLDGNGTIDVEEFRKMMRDGMDLDEKIDK